MANKRKRKYIVSSVLILVLSGALFFLATSPKLIKSSTISSAATQHTFYKWQDSNGFWHISDSVPEGANAQAVTVDTAANILQPVSAPFAPPEKETSNQSPISQPIPGVPMSINPADISQLFEQARALEHQIKERTAEIDKVR